MTEDRWLTTREAAEVLRISYSYLKTNWGTRGLPNGYQRKPKGRVLFKLSEVISPDLHQSGRHI